MRDPRPRDAQLEWESCCCEDLNRQKKSVDPEARGVASGDELFNPKP